MRPRRVEAQLAAEAQARGLAFDHYIEMIVKARSVEQVRHRSVAEAIDRIREASQREQTQRPQDQRSDPRGP